MDLTVAAIPFYFGSMEAERRLLRRRAATAGPSAADYERRDTVTSLTMGVASLVVPLASHALARHVVPGRGRYAKALAGLAAGAVVATTVADRVAGAGAPDGRPAASDEQGMAVHGPSRRVRRLARQIQRVAGPAAVGAGALLVASWTQDRTTPKRMWEKGRRHDLGEGPLAWALAVVGWDFVYYWNHRFMHEIRGMWAIHVVHHSSERYNLSTALRQPVADFIGVWVPYGVLSRLGVRPRLVEHARGVNLLYQYWIHTDAIRRLGPAESVLNTPSHHRVHHGRNREYIDRNHGSILIVWDRLFGTFQREGDPVVYGLTKNVGTFDPLVVATHELVDIARDVASSTTWRDRLSYVLRGPGWAYERHAARGITATAEEASPVTTRHPVASGS